MSAPRTLAEVQRWFLAAATATPGTGPADLAPADAVLRGTPALSAAARVGVYQEAYFARLEEAAADTFPDTRAALGEDVFHNLLLGWLAARPPAHVRIEDDLWSLADALASPVAPPPGVAAPPVVVGAEVARLARRERARARVVFAADGSPLTTDALRALPPAEWADLQLARLPATERVDGPDGEPGGWLVWRVGTSVVVHDRPLEPLERELLDAIDAGATFAALGERAVLHLVASGGDATAVAPTLVGLLACWVGEGWIGAAG